MIGTDEGHGDMDYDLAVIGGGAGGLSAARAGRRRGARTLLVQDGPLGGDCTFTGCVPSKAVIAAANAGASFSEAMTRAADTVAAIAATETPAILEAEGVEVLDGRATFSSPHEITVDGHRIRAAGFVLATGAGPAVPPVDGLAELDHLTNESVFSLTEAPDRLAVLGGGAIGSELAQAMARLGVQVTLMEAMDRLLGPEEPEAAAAVLGALRADGVDVRLGQAVTKAEALDAHGGVRLHTENGEPVETDRVLVAVGRRPVTDGLEPEAAGVELTDRGFIETDERLRTTARHIYAVGDVTGRLLFTHAADAMGRLAVENLLTHRIRHRRFDAGVIPWATFTDPEVGRVGLTEAQAAQHGGRVAYLPMAENDRAVIEGRTEGFVKLIAGPRAVLRNAGGGRLLGATIVASRAGEMIHEPAIALRTKMFTGRLAMTAHAYPTWSVGVQKAAAQFFVEIEGRQARPAEA
jgi:pyruvate/2-oxoglutarate dehydrogenase complex dihydrolipoamide dehydrogenase (E3) component